MDRPKDHLTHPLTKQSLVPISPTTDIFRKERTYRVILWLKFTIQLRSQLDGQLPTIPTVDSCRQIMLNIRIAHPEKREHLVKHRCGLAGYPIKYDCQESIRRHHRLPTLDRPGVIEAVIHRRKDIFSQKTLQIILIESLPHRQLHL